MAIYESKFETGDEVFTANLGLQYTTYASMASLLHATNYCSAGDKVRAYVLNYSVHADLKSFVYLIEDENQHQYLFDEDGLELYNGQDKEQPCKGESCKDSSCKEVTKTGYVKCEKFTNICEYLTEGKIYSAKEYNGTSPVIVNDQGKDTWLVTVGRQDLHTGGVWQYATEEEYLAQQSPKQQYRQRAKWVKNTGEKPDLPDGTLVKVKFADGTGGKSVVEDLYWGLDILDTDCAVTKWKLADDWNDVVDGQAPDIEAATIVEVENTKEYMGNKFIGRVSDFEWEAIKKWRYAKEKKAK